MDLAAAVAAERRDLADLFDALTPAQWDAPSLCQGWRTREVVAHLTLGVRHGRTRLTLEAARSGGPHRMADRLARRDAARYRPEELTAFLRDGATHPAGAPLGGPVARLAHDVVHGLDVVTALGLDREVPLERVQAVLAAASPRVQRRFGVDLAGVRLEARDLGWTAGPALGPVVRGRGQHLVSLLFGRRLPAGLFTELGTSRS